MATFTFFHEFKKFLADGTIDLDSHTFKAVLTNTAPVVATDDQLADIVEIAAGNGYTAGGLTLATVTWLETGGGTGVWRFSADDFAWTAAGGSIGPFRYIVICDDTPVGDPLVGLIDWGSAVTVPDGGVFTVDIGASGIFELS